MHPARANEHGHDPHAGSSSSGSGRQLWARLMQPSHTTQPHALQISGRGKQWKAQLRAVPAHRSAHAAVVGAGARRAGGGLALPPPLVHIRAVGVRGAGHTWECTVGVCALLPEAHLWQRMWCRAEYVPQWTRSVQLQLTQTCHTCLTSHTSHTSRTCCLSQTDIDSPQLVDADVSSYAPV